MNIVLSLLLALTGQLPILTLADAVRIGQRQQPQNHLAEANTQAAEARVGEARATLLPQLSGIAAYQRTTANFTQRPGLLPNQVNAAPTAPPTFQTFNFFNFQLALNQYIWDFRAPFALGSYQATAEAQLETQRYTRDQVLLSIRNAFFNARAQKALAQVARDNLGNQERHRAQTKGFVEVGTQPEISLATAETTYANAEVQLINADNSYEIAKVLLNQAMGVDGPTDFDVADEWLPPAEGEDDTIAALYAEALKGRLDLQALDRQLKAQALAARAALGGFGPTFSANMSLTDAGIGLDDLTWNWATTVTASWTFFDGLLTYSQVKEARANLRGIEAQRDALKLQVRADVSQAVQQVRAGKAGLGSAQKALVNASLQLKLAEGRYQEGLGNIIELSDAELASTTAAAGVVQAEYALATARAQLLRALGRH